MLAKGLKSFVNILLLYGVIFCCTGCEPYNPSDPGTIQKVVEDPLVQELIKRFDDASSEFQELSKPNRVEAWVDKLIIKAQPGQEMPQIGILQQGERAEYLYQSTRRKSEFMLRNQRYYEPWILIRTQQGLIGWVHKGGVRFIDSRLEDFLSNGNTFPQPSTRSINPNITNTDYGQEFIIIPGQRVGNITVNTSEKDLMQMIGPANIDQGALSVSSDNDEKVTIVYPNTRDEFYVSWKDAAREKIKAIYFLREDSRWVTLNGLRAGLELLELTKINEGPLEFYGFNWEYAGTVENWNGGKLAQIQDYFYVRLKAREPLMAREKIDAFSGKRLFSSNTEGVLALDLIVDRLVVYLD